MIGTCYDGFSALERLPQAVEHLGIELRQLIQKQHPVVGERDLARFCPNASPDKGRH